MDVAVTCDEHGIVFLDELWILGDEALRVVALRGGTWLCCRCGALNEDDGIGEVDVPAMLFLEREGQTYEVDLCFPCFGELVAKGVLSLGDSG